MALTIVSTHPIQYHAPVYRFLNEKIGIPTTVIYAANSSLVGYYDREFQTKITWDTDLLSGYKSVFLHDSPGDETLDVSKLSHHGLEQAMQASRPKVVLLPGYGFPYYRWAWVYAAKNKYPRLFRMEAYDEPYRTSFLKSAGRDFILRWVYGHSQGFLYIGRAAYQHYKRLRVPENKLFFSPYGVSAEPFEDNESDRAKLRPMTRESLKIGEDEIVILFSGKLIPKKDPAIILQMINKLDAALQKKTVVLYLGEGALKASLDKLSRSCMAKVHFVGFKNQTQLSPYYHAADVLILPSLYTETWGLVVNEALLHGLPVIVSDRVGCRLDLILAGRTGEVFEAANADDLGDAYERISSYIRQPWTRTACKQLVSNYSVEAAAKGIAEAYEAVVRR